MKRHVALTLAISLTAALVSSCASRPAEEATVPEPALAEFRTSGDRNATQQLEDLFTTIDLLDATIAELTAEMEAGHVTSAELTQMYLDRIAAFDDELNLNSITNINPNALEDAAALDREREAGVVRGPLHGIPLIVKDNIDVAGMATTAGSVALAGNIAREDAFVVKRLREAGAVILAKANMSEFARRTVDSHSTLGGNVHNAYDTAKTPGGSSGGTAVAITCNFAAAGLGTDTGGSIRYPAAFSNLFGLRPSKGLTSTAGVFPLTATNDTVGPMARNAEDLAVLLEVIAGTDETDDYTLEADADALKGDGYLDDCKADGLKGMRIGILTNSFTYHPDEEFRQQVQEYLEQTGLTEEEAVTYTAKENVQDMVRRARKNLIKAGATIVDISEELPDEMVEALFEGMGQPNTNAHDIDAYLSGRPGAPYASLRELADAGTPEASDNVIHSYVDTLMSADEGEEGAQGAQGAQDAQGDEGDAKGQEDPYSQVGAEGYARPPYWQTYLDGRETVQKILRENDVDAVMYLEFFDVPPDDATAAEDISMNYAGYAVWYPIYMGFPEIMVPMGFSEATEECPLEYPMGLSIFSGFGGDDTLVQIASAYQRQAGGLIRRMPADAPALTDERLNGFLETLMEAAYSIDTFGLSGVPAGRARMLEAALRKAEDVDTSDPYAVYEVTAALARAYDRLSEAL